MPDNSQMQHFLGPYRHIPLSFEFLYSPFLPEQTQENGK